MNQSNYFTMEESEQFTFYRVPKVLMTDSRYNAVTAEAKLLYGLLLDRMSLSTKNGWCDDNGLIFIYFTIRESMECLSCGHDKARNLFCELEKVDLLERRRQGQGKPSILYVKKFISDIVKSATNNTDINETDCSDTNLSIYRDEIDIDEMVKENIEYDILAERCPAEIERIDELVCLMVDTLSSTKNIIQISGNDFPKEVVKSRFMKLTFEHIEYVLDMLKKNPSNIRNIRAYLLSALYNAPTTIDNYYTALVNHDFNGRSA